VEKPFLGRGWRFPIQPDALGRLGYVEGDANVEQSIYILLLTTLGERMMRYDFGCDASRLVQAPGSQRFLSLLEVTVRDALQTWEPRVELEQVFAEVDPREENHVTVSVLYRIRQSNTRGSLVFPFDLGVGEL